MRLARRSSRRRARAGASRRGKSGVVSPQGTGSATVRRLGREGGRVQVFILDAHSIYRGGLAACLSAFEEVGGVGEACDEAAAEREHVVLGYDGDIVHDR